MHFNIFGYKKIKIHLLIKNCLTMFVALVSETKPSLSSMMASSALARLPSICRIWELVKPNQELTTRKVVWKKKTAREVLLNFKGKVNLGQYVVDKIVVMNLGVYALEERCKQIILSTKHIKMKEFSSIYIMLIRKKTKNLWWVRIERKYQLLTVVCFFSHCNYHYTPKAEYNDKSIFKFHL